MLIMLSCNVEEERELLWEAYGRLVLVVLYFISCDGLEERASLRPRRFYISIILFGGVRGTHIRSLPIRLRVLDTKDCWII